MNLNHKPNKKWVGKDTEFYKRLMKSWFQDNNTEMHSTHNKEKSVTTKKVFQTLKKKIYKYIA